MAARSDDQSGRVLGARYRLLAPVGTGASATVYEADDVQLRRRVAVKLLHPSLAADASFLKRFRAEAQAAANLSHPNVLAVFDWGEDNGTPYLVLEYLAGGSLRAMLDRSRLLSPSQLVVIGLEAARGLDYAHKRGVVHRDIKPANLLFGEDGRLRIADFGLARAISEASWTEPAGVMLGTARYASPEQATGLPLTGKSDVYSLTLSLVEAATGSVPFSSDTTVATLMARLGKLMPVSADLGPIAPVLERAGRPEPDDRYDASEFGRALLACAERLPRPGPLPLVIALHAPSAEPTSLAPASGAVAIIAPPIPSAPPAAAARLEPPPARAVDVVAPMSGGGGRPPAPPADKRAVTVDDGLAPLPTLPGKRRLGRGALWGLIGLVVAALATVGVVVYNGSRTKTYPVTSLVGISQGQAENEVSPHEWVLSPVLEKSDDYPQKGTIIRQEPGVDVKLKKGATITVWVSDGPTPSALPDLVNKPKADAEAALGELKLKLNETAQADSEDIAAGSIVSWTVSGQALKPGDKVEKGTQVDVVVSRGPAPRQVPEIRGMNWDNAKAAIEAVQLKAKRLDDIFSDKWDAGIVARIEPGVGATLPRDGEVQVAISKGPDVVAVPNIYGDSITKAEEKLTAAGLERSTLDGPLDRPVIDADPKPGTIVRRGTKVKVRTG